MYNLIFFFQKDHSKAREIGNSSQSFILCVLNIIQDPKHWQNIEHILAFCFRNSKHTQNNRLMSLQASGVTYLYVSIYG